MPTRALFCDYRGLWLDSDLACAATPACVLPCVFLQHVALRGRPEFKRSLQRRTENIKAPRSKAPVRTAPTGVARDPTPQGMIAALKSTPTFGVRASMCAWVCR